jgi:methylated-DNA-protein-cysteine methyltransferase related protein
MTKNLPDFYMLVYEVVKQIPYGRVTSYGAIAKCLGTAQSSRMVGYALNNCHHLEEPVPAHRVVNRNGLLSGKHHFDGPDVMQQLLESEGIEVEKDKVVKFKELFWDPMQEIEI